MSDLVEQRTTDLYPSQLAGVWEQPVYDEVVLYCQDQNLGISLNRSAAAVWGLCDGSRTAAEICRQLARDLCGSPDEELAELLTPDVAQTLAELQQLGVLVYEAAPAKHPGGALQP